MATPGRTQPHLPDALACGGYTGYLVMGVFLRLSELAAPLGFLAQMSGGAPRTHRRKAVQPNKIEFSYLNGNLVVPKMPRLTLTSRSH
jgi:hypothetical protein